MTGHGLVVASLCSIALLTACSNEASSSAEARSAIVPVSDADLGDDWPLKVPSGFLLCSEKSGEQSLSFATQDDRVYALNAVASDAGQPSVSQLTTGRPDSVARGLAELRARGRSQCDD